jgi:hypothetical protein
LAPVASQRRRNSTMQFESSFRTFI